jgi:hypothetical protein
MRSPVSPLPGAGLPPSIPEEPHSPKPSVAEVVVEEKEPTQPPATESVLAPEPTVSHEIPKETAGPSTSAA